MKNKPAKRPTEKLSWPRHYVAGQTAGSLPAFADPAQVCETHLKGLFRITGIDLLKRPRLARGEQILAIPTVVRRLPRPMRVLIGDLADTARVLVGLDLRPVGAVGAKLRK